MPQRMDERQLYDFTTTNMVFVITNIKRNVDAKIV